MNQYTHTNKDPTHLGGGDTTARSPSPSSTDPRGLQWGNNRGPAPACHSAPRGRSTCSPALGVAHPLGPPKRQKIRVSALTGTKRTRAEHNF